MSRRRLLRDLEAGRSLDLFLVSAVGSVLLIRFGLHILGYPRIAPGTLHVAHMLWGGLLMMVALVLVISLLGRRVRQLAAFVGGVGFGTFIDEIGKFVTQDNDYFYQPAVALIYVTFVLLYLATRSLRADTGATSADYLVNALQEMEEIAVDDLDIEERDRVLRWLDRTDASDPLASALRKVVTEARVHPVERRGAHARVWIEAVKLYRRLVTVPAFGRTLVIFFVIQLSVKFVAALTVVLRVSPDPATMLIESPGFAAAAQLASTVLSAILALLGIVALRISWLEALRWFRRSILVSIFLTQVFAFYRHEWAALGGLGFDLLVFGALVFMIEREKSLKTSPPTAPVAAA